MTFLFLLLKIVANLKIYPANSIVIAMYGSTIGKVALLKKEATVNQACCVIPPSDNYESRYLFYCLIGMRSFLLSIAKGGAQTNINQEVIKSLRIPLPSKYQQRKIYRYLDKEVTNIKMLISDQQKLLALLKEKKQTLILMEIFSQM